LIYQLPNAVNQTTPLFYVASPRAFNRSTHCGFISKMPRFYSR
jgi:hypothetical protein